MGSLAQEPMGWEGEADKPKSPPEGTATGHQRVGGGPHVGCRGVELWTWCESLSHACGVKAGLTAPVEAGCQGSGLRTPEDSSPGSPLMCCGAPDDPLRLF